jgi:hypothetical protein
MGDQNLRVWPVEGDGYGDVIEYPRYAKYRMEPNYPGAAGDANHDLVVYEKDEDGEENELGRHHLTEYVVAFAGQPSPIPTAADPELQGSDARNTSVTGSGGKARKTSTSKAGTPAK